MLQPLSASDLLDLWERGENRTPIEQALVILEFAFPGLSADRLAHLTIGQRDACLLKVRELTFGSRLKGLAACPSCGERLEMAFDVGDLQPQEAALPDLEKEGGAGTTASLKFSPYEVTFRLPDSADLSAVAGMQDIGLARRRVLEACLLEVRKDGETAAPDELPGEVLDAVTAHMGQAEPLANLSLAVNCPACGHSWQVVFDIVAFLWNEIDAWAARFMREVHILASAYGWHEAEILAMSTWRRQRYLEMVGA